MLIRDITAVMEELFPLSLQEKYDNAGPQIFFGGDTARGVLLSLDVDAAVAREASGRGCNLIISHHPFFFRAIKRITDTDPRSSLLMELMKGRISLYAAHTNLDKVYHDRLAPALGFQGSTLLLEAGRDAAGAPAGFGVLVELAQPIELLPLVRLVKERLGLEYLQYGGGRPSGLRRLALLNGAGGGSMDRIIDEHRPDCILTGDVGYHQMKSAIEQGVAVIDAGHFGTERIYLDFLKEDLETRLAGRDRASAPPLFIGTEESPFRVFPLNTRNGEMPRWRDQCRIRRLSDMTAIPRTSP